MRRTRRSQFTDVPHVKGRKKERRPVERRLAEKYAHVHGREGTRARKRNLISDVTSANRKCLLLTIFFRR